MLEGTKTRMRTVGVGAGLAAIACLAAGRAGAVEAQIARSFPTAFSGSPVVAADSTGRAVVVWSGESSIWALRVGARGGVGPLERVAGRGVDNLATTEDLDAELRNGQTVVAYARSGDIHVVRSLGPGRWRSVASPQGTNPGSGLGRPSVGLDASRRAVILWSRPATPTSPFGLGAAVGRLPQLGSPSLFGTELPFLDPPGIRPGLAVTSGGRVDVVWRPRLADPSPLLASTLDTFGSWTAPVELAPPSATAVPLLEASGARSMLIASETGGLVGRVTGSGDTWSAPQVIARPPLRLAAGPSLVTDGAGGAAVSWVTRSGRRSAVWVSMIEPGSLTWSTARRVVVERDTRIAASADVRAGTVIVAWVSNSPASSRLRFRSVDHRLGAVVTAASDPNPARRLVSPTAPNVVATGARRAVLVASRCAEDRCRLQVMRLRF